MSAEGRRATHGGPPRRADDQTGSGTAFAAAVARALPGVVQYRVGATTTFATGAKSFLVLEPDDLASLRLDLASSEPFRARLTRLSENTTDHIDELAELFEESWRALAPKRALAAHNRGEDR